jgi:purine-binding chemotaxis protein CheW
MSDAVAIGEADSGEAGAARPSSDEAEATDTFILCQLAGATYGIPSQDIAHLEMVGSITPVPNAPASVEGVVSTRGQVIPVLNLRARFGFPKVASDLRSRLVVIRSEGRAVGLLVDGAREFASIPRGSIRPPPEDIADISGDYIEGLAEVGDRLVLILRTKHLLAVEIEGETSNLPSAAAGSSENPSDQ